MAYSSRSDHGLTALVALLITMLGAALAYWVLMPTVGIDDANITQVYGRNLAAGHGYVYNIGGERVEGSTSLIWTLINAVAFWISSTPEIGLAALSAVFAWVTLFSAMRITRELTAESGPIPALLTGAAFLAFPAFFGWMIWSLMDVTLWVMVIAVMVWLLCRIDRAGPRGNLVLGVAVLAALLPVTRPEGIALTMALAGFYVLRWLLFAVPGLLTGLVIGLAGVGSFAAATAWRLSYFGYPVPNTFYAKTSTDLLAQAELGARYVLSYLQEPQNVLLFVSFCLSGAMVLSRGGWAQRGAFWLSVYLIVGGVMVYTVLGGDHFGSHRQFLYFLPLALPIIVAGLASWVPTDRPQWQISTLLIVPFVVIALVAGTRFVQTKGNMIIEFAIADAGRVLGDKLNALPGTPSIGVFAAGAIRMTYDHEVLDLLGLNWTKMAHAPDDGYRSDVPNQHGFNSNVFWESPPDVLPIFPSDSTCPSEWVPLSGYLDAASDQISQTERFRTTYDLFCDAGVSFYAARDYVTQSWEGDETGAFQKILPNHLEGSLPVAE